jgi:hypothetical protein
MCSGPMRAYYNPAKKTWDLKYEYRSKAPGNAHFHFK